MWETALQWPFRKKGQVDGWQKGQVGIRLPQVTSLPPTLTRAILVGGNGIIHYGLQHLSAALQVLAKFLHRSLEPSGQWK